MTEPTVSICIPTYDANGAGPVVLNRLIQSIHEQSFTDYEIIVSDHDAKLDVETSGHRVLAFAEHKGSSAHNTNNAMRYATGKYIQIMNHDDFFYHENVLRDMVHQLESSDKHWAVCQCLHTDANETQLYNHHIPSWPGEKAMVEGVNRIGCPSVAIFERELGVQCTPDLALCLDCALWIDLFRAGGEPLLHPDVGVVIRMWPEQLSNQIDYPKSLEEDKVKLRAKYGYV